MAGTDLIRRTRGALAYGLTFPLITRADGKKFGKSEQGNVWLDPGLTSPYAFYQFWLNSDDAEVERYLKFFTFLPLDEIAELARTVESDPARREAQRVLAAEVTRLVHGAEALARAERLTAVLFAGDDLGQLTDRELAEAFAHSPSTELPRAALGTPEAALTAVLAATELAASRGQARKDIAAGGVYVDNRRVADTGYVLSDGDVVGGGFIVLRKGKKSYHLLRLT